MRLMVGRSLVLVYALYVSLILGGSYAAKAQEQIDRYGNGTCDLVMRPMTKEQEASGNRMHKLISGAYEHRIEQLERKVSGMQKQITVLHAKKADKPAGSFEEIKAVDHAQNAKINALEAKLQETRDQTAHLVQMLRSRK